MILSRIGRVPGAIGSRLSDSITSINQIRCLYSGEELGIKKYEESRKVVEYAIANHDFFKQQFRKQLLNTEYSLTHVEYGLKNLLHIMQNSHSDVSLLRNALQTLIYRWHSYEGDKYRFDTIVLRTFHYLNMPKEAMEFFEDDTIAPVFSQVTGYQILLDLLYDNEKYDDVLRIYNTLISSGRLRQNKYIDVIILASYYQLNTPAAFQQAYDLWNKISEKGNKVQYRKSRTFVAGLALKQNHPEIALSILEGETMYVTMRHIKLLAWAQLGQFDNVFKMLLELIKLHAEKPKLKPMSSTSVLNDIEKCIHQKGSEKDRKDFRNIRERTESLDLITNKSLDDLLCAPFPILPQANLYHKRL